MAKELKVGDKVKHKDWPVGEVRTVVNRYRQKFPNLGGIEAVVCVLDAPAFPRDHVSFGAFEDALYDRWMEQGLEKVDD